MPDWTSKQITEAYEHFKTLGDTVGVRLAEEANKLMIHNIHLLQLLARNGNEDMSQVPKGKTE